MKISIITPYSKEYAHFLPECIETLKNQTFQDFEHILWEYNEKPFNLPRARNQAIRTAKGEYIVCLDADDRLDPTYLERCLELATPDTIVTTGVRTFGDTVWEVNWAEDAMTYQHFLRRNRCHVTSMYPRRAWEVVGGYDEKFEAYEDWDFWTRCAKAGFKYRSILDYIFFYRQHPHQMTKHVPTTVMDRFIAKHFKAFEEDELPFRAGDPYL